MREILPLVLLSIFLINCKQNSQNFEKKEDFIRDWKVIRYPYSNATLYLSANHTFKYEETGHLSEIYSEGIWKMNNDTLILNSLQPNECLYIDDFSLTKGETIDDMQTTLKNCEPKPNSKFFTEFNNSKFTVTKDSLIYLNLNPEYLKKYGNYKIF